MDKYLKEELLQVCSLVLNLLLNVKLLILTMDNKELCFAVKLKAFVKIIAVVKLFFAILLLFLVPIASLGLIIFPEHTSSKDFFVILYVLFTVVNVGILITVMCRIENVSNK